MKYYNNMHSYSQLVFLFVAVVDSVRELCILQGMNCEVLQQHAQQLPAGVTILWLLLMLL